MPIDHHPSMQVDEWHTYKDADVIMSREQLLQLLGHHLDCVVGVAEWSPQDPFAGKFASYQHSVTASEVLSRIDTCPRARVRSFGVLVVAYLGRKRTIDIANMVHSALWTQQNAVQEQQPNGRWVPVAWRGRTERVQRSARMRVRSETDIPTFEQLREGQGSRDRTEAALETIERVVVDVVWWDELHLDNTDLVAEYTQGRIDGSVGPGRVSKALSKELALAREVLRLTAEEVVRPGSSGGAAPGNSDARNDASQDENAAVLADLKHRVARSEYAIGKVLDKLDELLRRGDALPPTPSTPSNEPQ